MRVKPHLWSYLGVWHCKSGVAYFVGLGFTPVDAFDDWRRANGRR